MDFFSIIYWNIEPKIPLGLLNTSYYGILFALGFVVGYQIIERILICEGKNRKDMDSLTITMVISTVVGARLGHCLFYDPAYYLSHPIEILMIHKGGLASHGAAIGILLGLWIFTRYKPKYTLLWILDRMVIVVALAGSFIRLGNFFNSEIYGIPSDMPWAVVFERVDSIPRHPVQLYESFAYLAIFLFLFFKYRQKREKTPSGSLFGYFLVLIFGARFLLEIFKVEQAAFITPEFPMTMGQMLSVPFVLIGLYFLWRSRKLSVTNTQHGKKQNIK